MTRNNAKHNVRKTSLVILAATLILANAFMPQNADASSFKDFFDMV